MPILENFRHFTPRDSLSLYFDHWRDGIGSVPGIGSLLGVGSLPVLNGSKNHEEPVLVQERPGFHLGIIQGVEATGRQAALTTVAKYRAWLKREDRGTRDTYKSRHFTIAVGGGNTVRNQYKALLRHHFRDINWLDHVRFFFIEETCNAKNWAGTRETLVSTLIEPLAENLIAREGMRAMTRRFELPRKVSRREVVERVVELMTFPIDMSAVEDSIQRGDREGALEQARREARRYQELLQERLGPELACHMIISGIGKDGGIGAFTPYAPELKSRKPGVIAVDQANAAISVALNRGALTSADCISLIIAGSLKLKALGRFEMDDSARFEQTVQETPIRMLRENRDIAEKVYIFADDRALYFEEDAFRFQENGKLVEVKSELRRGSEEGGIHMLLVHGFMGLYSYINLLIGLPSAWTVSAMRRGRHAKTLPNSEVFPHYANALKKMIMRDWRSQQPTPFCCHSMAGLISDHLLLSVLSDYDDDLPEYDELNSADRRLIDALRTGGMVEIATWAPSDIAHLNRNIEIIRAHRKNPSVKLELAGPKDIYTRAADGSLEFDHDFSELRSMPAIMEVLLKLPGVESVVNALNIAVRYVARTTDLPKLMKRDQMPYGQRMLGDRVLQKVSFYGVMKEMNAAMHQPEEAQRRHLKALQAVIKYDIPYLVIVHMDDFMVSANRHIQEHRYLLAARKAKEGVTREADLEVPMRLVVLKSEGGAPPENLIDPHFLILSHTDEGAGNARIVTAEITDFVNANVARAIRAGRLAPLPSVAKWSREKAH